MFCEGHNIFIDFDKVGGQHSGKKPALGQQYLDFHGGSTFATCEKTDRSEFIVKLYEKFKFTK